MSLPFTITSTDIGRYVRQKSTGEIGRVRRDPGNGWLHPGIVYEWRHLSADFEYVEVIPARRGHTLLAYRVDAA